MGSEPPKYLVIHEILFLRNFVYFIFFAWSKVGLVQKILKRLGKVAWFQYKTTPQRNEGVSQKNQNKNFVKKRITKHFGGLDSMNELINKNKKKFKELFFLTWLVGRNGYSLHMKPQVEYRQHQWQKRQGTWKIEF